MLKRREKWLIGCIVVFALAWASPGSAALYDWNVPGPSSWWTAVNWSPNYPGPPNGPYFATDDARLDNGGTAVINALGSGGESAGGLNVYLGAGTVVGSDGTINLQSNDLESNWLYVGQVDTGHIDQDGGTNTAYVELNLGTNAGASGTYDLSSGAVDATNEMRVGDAGTGQVTHTGGTVNADELYLGFAGTGDGTYSLSGAASSVNTDFTRVGEGGTGQFNQSDGTHATVLDLVLGQSPGSDGTYNLSGGSLNVGGNLTVANGGTGTLTQTGGTVTVGGTTTIGGGGGGGAYNIGTGSLDTPTLNVGSNGVLRVTDSLGTVTVTNALNFAANSGFKGAEGGVTIHMDGADLGLEGSSGSALTGFWYLELLFEGGIGNTSSVEVAGEDLGVDQTLDLALFRDNFGIREFTLGSGAGDGDVRLINATANQGGNPEALYVWDLTVNAGSVLDLNGQTLYYRTLTNNGSILPNGGQLLQFEWIPEPASLVLFGAGVVAVWRRRRRRA